MCGLFRRTHLGMVVAAILIAGCKKPYTPPPPSSKYIQTVDMDVITKTAMDAAGLTPQWQSHGTSKGGGSSGENTNTHLEYFGDFTSGKSFAESVPPTSDQQLTLMKSIGDQFKTSLKSAGLEFIKSTDSLTPGRAMKIVIEYSIKKNAEYEIDGRITISLNPDKQSNLKIEVKETATNP